MAQRRTSRPDYSWSNFGDIIAAHDLGVATAIFGVTGSTINQPQTLIRTRGIVSATLNSGGVSEQATILCGLIQVNGDYFASSTDAPELLNNSTDEASWIWQGQLYVTSGFGPALESNNVTDRIRVDSKAMRKLKPGQVIVFVMQTPAGLVTDATGTLEVTYFFHCLSQT